MSYDRKIKYFQYFEADKLKKSVGFCKLEMRNAKVSLKIQINGIEIKNGTVGQVYIACVEKEKRIGEIHFYDGKGKMYLGGLESKNIMGSEISYERLSQIRIILDADRKFCCFINEEKNQEKMQTTEKIFVQEAAKEQEENREQEEKQEQKEKQEQEENQEQKEEQEQEEKQEQKEKQEQEEKQTQKEEQEQKEKQKEEQEENQEQKENEEIKITPVADQKWQQLWNIYEHLSPFGDDRTYLSISPGDFVIFPMGYYQLVNNSFTMHGFYRYKHLILFHTRKRGNEIFYFGVPGIFEEKEKQAAVMFGFECFEAKREPVEEGDYGYYMMKIEL